MLFMKVSEKKVLSVRCPTCGAKPGEKCELSTGLPRTDPHRDRRLAASDKVAKSWNTIPSVGGREFVDIDSRWRLHNLPQTVPSQLFRDRNLAV